jgi:hypothetical protein
MTLKRDRWFVFVIIILVLCATNLPYVFASLSSGGSYTFGGFLINPQDGNSYLAKMYQGWRGDWRFTLPYTSQSNNGAYLFLFYLGLGHLARLTGLSLLATFHSARIVGTVAMLLTMYGFISVVISKTRIRRLSFTIAALGSGLGWIAMIFGAFTSDFWVAEAYPFLSAYATPHFSFGLALMLAILILWSSERRTGDWLHIGQLVLASLILALIVPFAVVISLVIMLGYMTWITVIYPRMVDVATITREGWKDLGMGMIAVLLGGGPLLVYDYWIAQHDPILKIWNLQNQTPSPPIWDLVISLSPAFLLAVVGLINLFNHRQPREWLLLVWGILGLALIYVPWELQRRFITGIYLPLAILAAFGVDYLSSRWNVNYRFLARFVLLLVLPTNLLVVLAARHGILTRDPNIYLTNNEQSGLEWIDNNATHDALIAASPEMGMFIPARTGRKVIYGHPFESVNAEQEKQSVENCFREGIKACIPFLVSRGVDYLFIGPRERALGAQAVPEEMSMVFHQGEVRIYQVKTQE